LAGRGVVAVSLPEIDLSDLPMVPPALPAWAAAVPALAHEIADAKTADASNR
jgi:hypothetical protein